MSRLGSSTARLPESDDDIRLELAMDIAGLGTFDLDLATGRMSFSARSQDIHGSNRLASWDDWFALIHPDDQPDVLSLRDAILSNGALTDCEGAFRFRRPDGDERWIAKRVRVFRDAMGQPVRLCGVIADETDRRNAERRGARLTQELQHRVKNVLAVVRSLSKQTLETTDTLDDYAAHYDGRLASLARVQNMIARRVDGGVDLEEIVREELLQHAAQDGQVSIKGPHLSLDGKAAEYIGLVMHELAVNAVKYGALSARSGKVVIAWTLPARTPSLMVNWTEKGVPVLATKPAREGFGRQLIEQGLPYQLGATTSFALAPGGLSCSMSLPLNRISPMASL